VPGRVTALGCATAGPVTCARATITSCQLPSGDCAPLRPVDTQRAILRRAFDLGVTHFDLANNYGPPYGSN
jgi:aryl-alcohol dehydrogenase-like predicted oxidoreductase